MERLSAALSLCLLVVSSLFAAGTAHAQAERSDWDRLLDLDEIWWFGIDFSHAEFIDPAGFRQPEQIFPAHLNEWNDRFREDGIAQVLARKLDTDMHLHAVVVQPANDSASAEQIRSKPLRGNGLDLREIRASLMRYRGLPENAGIGVVAMVDRFDHGQNLGCVHLVFFDLTNRRVLDAPRRCQDVGGFGFIARWLRPVKTTVARMNEVRKEWRVFARKARKGRLDPPTLTRLLPYW